MGCVESKTLNKNFSDNCSIDSDAENQGTNLSGRCNSKSVLDWGKKRFKKKERHSIAELALAMHRAEVAAAALIGIPMTAVLPPDRANELIRQAKAEGSTTRIIDGHLYIDYKYVGRVPSGVRVRNG